MQDDGEMSTLGGLFGGYEGHRVRSEQEISAAVDSALVSIDANVLLSLYRYPDEFSTAILSAIEDLGDRVFVTHQALREFWRNRTSALADRARAKVEVEKRLTRGFHAGSRDTGSESAKVPAL